MGPAMTKKIDQEVTNEVVEIEAVDEAALVTVTGGRNYGWQGGGWDTSAPRESGFKAWSQANS